MKRFIVEMGEIDLDITVDADTDLDGQFKALCNDTGETISVNGWLIDHIQEV